MIGQRTPSNADRDVAGVTIRRVASWRRPQAYLLAALAGCRAEDAAAGAVTGIPSLPATVFSVVMAAVLAGLFAQGRSR